MFIARRMVILASEDIINADPQALVIAVAAMQAVHFVGLPAGRAQLTLSQAVIYLAALAPKNNREYKAILAAREDVKQYGALRALHLRNAPTRLMKDLGYSQAYRYPHTIMKGWVEQDYLPEALKKKKKKKKNTIISPDRTYAPDWFPHIRLMAREKAEFLEKTQLFNLHCAD